MEQMKHVSDLRCPFCGGLGVLDSILRDGYENDQDDPDSQAYFIRCKSCASNGGWAKSPGGALRLWNMRAAQQKSGGEEEVTDGE